MADEFEKGAAASAVAPGATSIPLQPSERTRLAAVAEHADLARRLVQIVQGHGVAHLDLLKVVADELDNARSQLESFRQDLLARQRREGGAR